MSPYSPETGPDEIIDLRLVKIGPDQIILLLIGYKSVRTDLI